MNARARKDIPYRDGIRIHFWEKHPNGKLELVTNLETMLFEEHTAVIPEPSGIELNQTQAQILMDDLWNCGIRPTEGAGTAGSMKATQRHLDDMRAIAFSKLSLRREDAAADGARGASASDPDHP